MVYYQEFLQSIFDPYTHENKTAFTKIEHHHQSVTINKHKFVQYTTSGVRRWCAVCISKWNANMNANYFDAEKIFLAFESTTYREFVC